MAVRFLYTCILPSKDLSIIFFKKTSKSYYQMVMSFSGVSSFVKTELIF